ncbi:MAG: sugar phosphate isomerase/epimerase [Chloroflexi bacterium]|nr:sugar phosphate isomerase/epimerase [Chloroflexota bacterium]
MKKSQLAINSVSTVRADLEECLAAYHDAGFQNVEFVLKHVKDYMTQGHDVHDVRALLDKYQIHCIGGFEMGVECFTAPEQRAENHARVVENARLLSALGAATMVVGTDGPADQAGSPDPVGEIARVFAQLAKKIKPTGITLCLEFNWSPVVKSLRTAAEIARKSRMSNVGVLFDPAHYHCTPTKFDQLNAQNIPCIRHVHVDDMNDKPGELSNCNSDRALPGKGCLDLKSIFNQLERYGYRGHYSIEMFDEKLWQMPARKAAKIMYQSLLPYVKR